MVNSFVHLVVIMDWHSRYVLSRELQKRLDKRFCVEALEPVLQTLEPEIFNTDQGAQFTIPAFVDDLENQKIRVSMDGWGRLYNNISVEWFWRSVKYEEIYLHEYQTVPDAREHLAAYFRFDNEERPHTAQGYRTPHEAYFGTRAALAPA